MLEELSVTERAQTMEQVWLSSYPKGVPHEIDPNTYASIPALLNDSFKKFSTRESFKSMGKSITYAEIQTQARHFSAFLQQEWQMERGDRIGIMLPNCLQYPIVLFAAIQCGLTAVNINPLYTTRELSHILKDGDIKALVVLDNFAHVAEEALPNTSVEHICVTRLGDMLGLKGTLVNFVLKHVQKRVPKYQLPGSFSLAKALKIGAQQHFDPPTLSHEDIAFLQYTGGTTGMAKGAILTHRNIIANVLQARTWLGEIPEETVKAGGIITALPLYHIFSLTANCFTFFSIGITNILITNPKDIKGFVKRLRKERFIAITGVNTLFNALLNNPDFIRLDFSNLKYTLGGGMAVQRAVAERWMKVTGVPLIEAYGLTETSPAVCINPVTLKSYNGSIGLPISSTQVCIRDEKGHFLSFDEPGELCVKGPQVMRGYWRRDKDTLEVLRDGWLHTGDIATIDEKGYVRIVDRKKDMINVSGFNVYPNEIEDVLTQHPGIIEAAVIGVPDERCGESVRAYVVARSPEVTEKAIIAHCRHLLTGYKIPRRVIFVKELPKTNVGKVLRRALRDEVLMTLTSEK